MVDFESYCIPGKKYPRGTDKFEDLNPVMEKSVRETNLKIWEYVKLENGSFVCFVYGHIEKFKNCKDYYYNLYRLDNNGDIEFLNAGTSGGIESLYVEDNFAYWDDFGNKYMVQIFNGFSQKYDKKDGWATWDFEKNEYI